MTSKDKILKVLNETQAYGMMENAMGGLIPIPNEMVANYLAAAGIGDIKAKTELLTRSQMEAAVYKRALGAVCQYEDRAEEVIREARKEIEYYTETIVGWVTERINESLKDKKGGDDKQKES